MSHINKLIVIHNLTETKLKKVLELDGIPMPSIAITKADIGHENFGEISFVFPKETIDPKNKKNKTYSADAWTPTFPQIEYDIDISKTREIHDKIERLIENIPKEYAIKARGIINGLAYNVNNYGGMEGLISRALTNSGMKAAYIVEKGGKVELLQKELIEKMSPLTIDLSKEIIKEFGSELEIIANRSGRDIMDKYGINLRNALFRGYIENGCDESFAQKSVYSMSSIMMVNILRQARDYQKAGPIKRKIITDYEKMDKSINNQIIKTEYRQWLEELFSGIIIDQGLWNGKPLYTSSGNSKSFKQTHIPYNAKNIVRAMLAQNEDVRNVTGFHGIKSIRASVAKEFKSLDDIANNSYRIRKIDNEEYNQYNEALEQRLITILSELVQKNRPHSNNPFIDMDSVGLLILDACANPTIESIKNILNTYHWDCNELQAEEIYSIIKAVQEMPVSMFESKPERVVGFDEIAVAIIPNNLDLANKQQLQEKGISIMEYEAGNEIARQKILMSLNDVCFGLGNENQEDIDIAMEL